METITIKVDTEIAKFYQESTAIKRQEIQTILNDWLKKIIQEKTLDDIILEMQEEAKNNGLTQEILDNILNKDMI